MRAGRPRRPAALRRSWLFLPGAAEHRLAQAAALGADVLIQELEDFTPPELRAHARLLSPEVFAGWRRAGALAAVRINPFETCGLDDLAGVMRGAPEIVMMSKVASAEQVAALDAAITGHEQALGLAAGSTEIVPNIETAAGLARTAALCPSNPRGPALAVRYPPKHFAASPRHVARALAISTASEFRSQPCTSIGNRARCARRDKPSTTSPPPDAKSSTRIGRPSARANSWIGRQRLRAVRLKKLIRRNPASACCRCADSRSCRSMSSGSTWRVRTLVQGGRTPERGSVTSSLIMVNRRYYVAMFARLRRAPSLAREYESVPSNRRIHLHRIRIDATGKVSHTLESLHREVFLRHLRAHAVVTDHHEFLTL